MATRKQNRPKKNGGTAHRSADNTHPLSPEETAGRAPLHPESETPHTACESHATPPEGENGTVGIILPGDEPHPESDHHTLPPPADNTAEPAPAPPLDDLPPVLPGSTPGQEESETGTAPGSEPETTDNPPSEPETPTGAPSADPAGTAPGNNPLLRHRDALEQRPDAPFYATLQQALGSGSPLHSRNEALDRLHTLVRIARLIDRITPRQPEKTEKAEPSEKRAAHPHREADTGSPRPYLTREHQRTRPYPCHYRPGLLDRHTPPHVSSKND